MFIVNANLTKPEIVKTQVENLLTKKTIIKQENLGQKEFAQPIKKHKSGFYFLFHAKLLGANIDGIKQKLYRMKDILRFLIINLNQEKRFRYRGKQFEKKDQPETSQIEKNKKPITIDKI